MNKVTFYQCSLCGEYFKSTKAHDEHYKYGHKCTTCKHSYWVYGCELNCALENNGKRCRFQEK